MAKATAKYNPVTNQDVTLTEEQTMEQQSETTQETPVVEETAVEVSPESINTTIDQIDEQSTLAVEQEPTPESVVVQEPVQASIAPVVNVQAAVKVEAPKQTELEQLVAKAKAEGNPFRAGIITVLETYLENMKPGKPVEPAQGAKHHYTLWHNLLSIINNCPEDEFRATWNLVLAYFNLNKDSALGDRYIFRFMHEWSQGNDQCKAYQFIINMIKLTMDPKERAHGLKQVSIDRSLTDAISENGRSKLLSFYQV